MILRVSAEDFIKALPDGCVDLILTDPPYFGIVSDDWDNTWPDPDTFVAWLTGVFVAALPKLAPHGSLVFFGALGKHGCHPFWQVCMALESAGYTFRNQIAWKKRRAYGKSHDYLFCREEIAWYSKSPERTEVRFNVPYLDEKRGYEGWNKDHPAKSEYKRVSNVWADLPELMRPTRTAEKPPEVMARLVETHSNPGDFVIDPFCGTNATGKACAALGRRYAGCDVNLP